MKETETSRLNTQPKVEMMLSYSVAIKENNEC